MREPEKRLHWMVTIFLGALLLPGWAAAGPANVELIIDASGSMAARMEGRSKMDIAKEVLSGLLADLPADAQVAVRAYGHRRKNDCNDIELLAPLGPRGSAPVEGRVKALKPVGMTPIAGSLEAAGKDFAGREGQRNVVILVSDGQETCKGDPCAVAKGLRQAGVQVEVNVIGFDVKADERKQLECIAEGGGGRYYNAANAKEFQVAAAEVKQQVAVAPPTSPADGGAFRDDFEGSKLNPAWKILKEDKNRWTLEGGKLVLVTQKGSIAEKQDDLRNQFILDRPLPDNYTVNVKLAVTLRSHNNWAGFQIYLDKDNYLNLGYWAKPWGNNIWRQAFFSKEVEGQVNRLEFGPRHIGGEGGTPQLDFIGGRNNPEAVWLRLEKRGSTFTASFSMDGAKWHKIGDHTMLRMGSARLSLAAANAQADAAEVSAEFDFVEVQPAP